MSIKKEKFSVASLKGLRQENEDKHFTFSNRSGKYKQYNNIDICCVFDGHGGKGVSTFLSENVPKYYLDKRINYPVSKNQVYEISDTLQKILHHNHRDFSYHSGSTALVAIAYDTIDTLGKKTENLTIINTGDCRAVLCRSNMAYALTKDHKPNWPEEKARIEQMGGQISFASGDWRIGDLSVSRAFGDIDNGPYVTHRPQVFRHSLNRSDKFVILGCDGIWDVLENHDAVNFVLAKCYDKNLNKRINSGEDVARELAKHALEKGSTDNLSVVVMFFD